MTKYFITNIRILLGVAVLGVQFYSKKGGKGKKRIYNQKRVFEIEHGRFTPLVFGGTNGAMAKECKKKRK